MPEHGTKMKTDMGWTQEVGLWDFTFLAEPHLSSELARLAGVKSVTDSDVVTFQPCTNPEERSQDRYAINDWPLPGGTWSFRALFDGHAGHDTVDYTVETLPQLIHDALRNLLNEGAAPTPEAVSQMLKDVIAEVDNGIGQAVRDVLPAEEELANMSDEQVSNIINDNGPTAVIMRRCMSGTTALVSLADPSKKNVWVASLGDCAAIMGWKKSDQWVAQVLSVAHNGEAKGEAEKIIGEHPNEPEVMLDNRVLGCIAVTRAIGDFEFKLPAVYSKKVLLNLDPGYTAARKVKVNKAIPRNLTPPYMSSVPDVKHVDLNAEGIRECFIILCTDGLVDMHDERLELDTILSKRWVEFLGPQISNTDKNLALTLLREGLGGSDVEKVSRMITVEMTERWTDDTTIIVQRLSV